MVAKYKELGFTTLVVAYTARFDVFFYQPSPAISYFSEAYGTTVSSADTTKHFNKLKDGADFLTVLMDEANNQGLGVVLGVGPSGDEYLSIDITYKANAHRFGSYESCDVNNLQSAYVMVGVFMVKPDGGTRSQQFFYAYDCSQTGAGRLRTDYLEAAVDN